MGFKEEDLEGDFDPAHYDEVMSRVFNDEYDAMPVDTEKPVFSDSEGESRLCCLPSYWCVCCHGYWYVQMSGISGSQVLRMSHIVKMESLM